MGGGVRNWDFFGSEVNCQNQIMRSILSDPQTNGGLLISVDGRQSSGFVAAFRDRGRGADLRVIGEFSSVEKGRSLRLRGAGPGDVQEDRKSVV